MLIEKVVVHEGEGSGNSRRQRIDIYLNFIGAFEVPAHIVTPMEAEEQRRQQEEQAAKEARSQELAKAREEKRKAEKREFTDRIKSQLSNLQMAGIISRFWVEKPCRTGTMSLHLNL